MEWASREPGRPTTLGQLLARQLAKMMPLDPSSGFEEVIEVEPKPFPGRVVVLDTTEALQQAQESRIGLTL
jgi:hypothetical protein